MIFNNLKEPEKGKPITAEWGRDVVRAIKSLSPQSGPGIKISRSMIGTTYSATAEEGGKKSLDLDCEVCPAIVTGREDGATIVDLYENGLAGGATKKGVMVYATEEAKRHEPPLGTVLLVHATKTFIVGGKGTHV